MTETSESVEVVSHSLSRNQTSLGANDITIIDKYENPLRLVACLSGFFRFHIARSETFYSSKNRSGISAARLIPIRPPTATRVWPKAIGPFASPRLEVA